MSDLFFQFTLPQPLSSQAVVFLSIANHWILEHCFITVRDFLVKGALERKLFQFLLGLIRMGCITYESRRLCSVK